MTVALPPPNESVAETPPPRFQRLAWDWTQPVPPPAWLVEGMIAVDDCVILGGDPGAGKSWLALHLALCVARGEPFLGRDCARSAVLVIDGENSPALVIRRVAGLGLDNSTAECLHLWVRQGVNLSQPDHIDEVRDYVAHHGIGLAVFDTVYATSVAEDLNDNAQVVAAFRVLRSLGCAVVLLAHHRKGKSDGSSSGDALLGAKQWQGQADAHFALIRQGDTAREEGDDVTQLTTVAHLHQHKSRDGATIAPLVVVLESLNRPDGSIEHAEVRCEGRATKVSSQVERLMMSIPAALQDGPLSSGDLQVAVGLERGTNVRAWREATRKLIDYGVIRQAEKRGPYEAVRKTAAEPGL